MTPQEIREKGKIITTYFDKDRNVLLMLPTPHAVDPVSGDMMIDDDEAYRKGLDINGIYGMCINYRYADWQTGSIFTWFY